MAERSVPEAFGHTRSTLRLRSTDMVLQPASSDESESGQNTIFTSYRVPEEQGDSDSEVEKRVGTVRTPRIVNAPPLKDASSFSLFSHSDSTMQDKL